MPNKKNEERVREYLEYVATMADNLAIVESLLETTPDDDFYIERRDEYKRVLSDAKRTIGQMDDREGYALICRYVDLRGDAWMMRKFNYSRSGMYRFLERAIKDFYDYLPSEFLNPKNKQHK